MVKKLRFNLPAIFESSLTVEKSSGNVDLSQQTRITGTSSYAGYGNARTISHSLGKTPSNVIVVPTADPQGYLGEVWISWTSTNFTVKNSGSYTGSFTYTIFE